MTGLGPRPVVSDEVFEVTMDILDAGDGVDGNRHGQMTPDGTAESGHGLALMTAFNDQVAFDSVLRHAGSVHLMKTLRWANGSPTVAAGELA